ncbi:uncharacterized protein LOC141618228 [Silene latifolia]|uniref:uncharacterized protein LOC141618228 n=1 Tax=Silene latifolia TaxID=37657 RepID=UPI003D76CA00
MLVALRFPLKFRHYIMQCVTTASYSLNLNGNVFGFFKGQRGLRQGDPLSPLLFTICMEYLTRLMAHTTRDNGFRYHSLCKPLKLTHLMFADDLLLFCKGDAKSIMIILRTFSTFSRASGLRMSQGKSNAYFNGVKSNIKAEILQISGFVEGQLPFKYLGVPIKTTGLNSQDCKPLIEKIVSKIRGLGARKLSYAGRLVLVKAVLKTYHTYWASMFILPKGVIAHYTRTPLISWDKICKPKTEGGLGLKDDAIWNQAAIGKLVWWIFANPDQLWVKWVNHIYIKQKTWIDYSPPPDSSWYWRKICQTKGMFETAYRQQAWKNQKGLDYTVAKGYDYLRHRGDKVQWFELVWHKWSTPKHSILAWLYHHNGLNLKEKLQRLGIIEEDTCCICGLASETKEHLFFRCQYSMKVIEAVGTRLNIRLPTQNLPQSCRSCSGSKNKIGILSAIINACMYNIWKQRNASRLELQILRPTSIASSIVDELRIRLMGFASSKEKDEDRRLIERIIRS